MGDGDIDMEEQQFESEIRAFIKEKFRGEVLLLKKRYKGNYYIKFKTRQDVWFQALTKMQIEVDSVDFTRRTISGFIFNSELNN